MLYLCVLSGLCDLLSVGGDLRKFSLVVDCDLVVRSIFLVVLVYASHVLLHILFCVVLFAANVTGKLFLDALYDDRTLLRRVNHAAVNHATVARRRVRSAPRAVLVHRNVFD